MELQHHSLVNRNIAMRLLYLFSFLFFFFFFTYLFIYLFYRYFQGAEVGMRGTSTSFPRQPQHCHALRFFRVIPRRALFMSFLPISTQKVCNLGSWEGEAGRGGEGDTARIWINKVIIRKCVVLRHFYRTLLERNANGTRQHLPERSHLPQHDGGAPRPHPVSPRPLQRVRELPQRLFHRVQFRGILPATYDGYARATLPVRRL